MQFQVLFKSGQAHKPLERRLPHLPHIFKTKMIRDQRFDLLYVIVRESEFAADPLGHPRAHYFVVVEADSPVGLVLAGGADIDPTPVLTRYRPASLNRKLWVAQANEFPDSASTKQ